MLNLSNYIYEGTNVDTNNLFTSKPHGIITYDNLKKQGESVYNYSNKGIELSESSKNQSNWFCNNLESKSFTNTLTLINYELNESKISAMQTELGYTGKIKCEKIIVSSGSEEEKNLKSVEFENREMSYKKIESRMVKSEYLVPCHGETQSCMTKSIFNLGCFSFS